MATVTLKKEPAATETPRECLDRTRAAECAANKARGAADAAVSRAWRDAQHGTDPLAKLRAEIDLPRLRLAAAEAANVAATAKQLRIDATGPLAEDRVAHYKPLVIAKVRELDEALETVRAINADLQTLGMQARSDSARDAFDLELSWAEFGAVDRPQGACKLANWRERMFKYGWLSS